MSTLKINPYQTYDSEQAHEIIERKFELKGGVEHLSED